MRELLYDLRNFEIFLIRNDNNVLSLSLSFTRARAMLPLRFYNFIKKKKKREKRKRKKKWRRNEWRLKLDERRRKNTIAGELKRTKKPSTIYKMIETHVTTYLLYYRNYKTSSVIYQSNTRGSRVMQIALPCAVVST